MANRCVFRWKLVLIFGKFCYSRVLVFIFFIFVGLIVVAGACVLFVVYGLMVKFFFYSIGMIKLFGVLVIFVLVVR